MLFDENRRGARGDQSTERCEAIEELCAAALVQIDGSIDWYCYPHIESWTVYPDSREPPSRGAFVTFDAAQLDDDVLDQWLASLTPGELDGFLEGLARDQDDQCSMLEPTA
jgi:hypothetical protein